MSDIRQTLAALKALRGNFGRLIAEEAAKNQKFHSGVSELRSGTTGRLRARTLDGVNSGTLRMHVYAPDHLPSNPPLVVALHGCGQTALDYDQGTGWSQLADRHGFVVLYPEQQSSNNPKRCFSWFQPGDIGRDLGEAKSIHQMVEHAVTTFDIDRRRVFITGLSAGGAMAAVMLAAYPEVYASGAIIAGLPYGCASSVQEAFDVMFNTRYPSARALGDRVRAARQHQGPWPRVSVWHGTADNIVKPSNAENLIKQWSDVHRLPAEPTKLESLGPHSRRVWEDANGECQIEAITVAGMGHGVPLTSPTSPHACGVPGPFFLDVGLSSTAHIAAHFGIGGAAAGFGWATEREGDADMAKPRADGHEYADSCRQAEPLDPNSVIAAAFKAAGLPTPSTTSGRMGVDPSAIVEATLKAAGLWRR